MPRPVARYGPRRIPIQRTPEAYHVAADFRPDFALLDLNLQDGYGSIASSLVALKAGAADYLAKPLPDRLAAGEPLGPVCARRRQV